MKYTELTVHTTNEASEIVADAMWNYTDFGVTVCDVNDIIALQKTKDGYWDYIDENLRDVSRTDVLVKCYLEEATAQKIAAAIMDDIFLARERAAGAIDFGTLEEAKRQVDGDDWIEVWKKHFRPIHLSRIVVVPEWIKYGRRNRAARFEHGVRHGRARNHFHVRGRNAELSACGRYVHRRGLRQRNPRHFRGEAGRGESVPDGRRPDCREKRES